MQFETSLRIGGCAFFIPAAFYDLHNERFALRGHLKNQL